MSTRTGGFLDLRLYFYINLKSILKNYECQTETTERQKINALDEYLNFRDDKNITSFVTGSCCVHSVVVFLHVYVVVQNFLSRLQ